MRWVFIIIGVVLIALGLAAYGPGSLKATSFAPPPPEDTYLNVVGPPREALRTEVLDFHGAEDLERGPDGRLYASLADGRIMARSLEGSWTQVADTGGRPLGLSFAPDGALFVADALKGLLRLGEDGEFETWMADESEGGELVFTDDLTVLDDGSVILTDASKLYGYGEHMASFFAGDQTGVVYRVTAPDEFEVLAEGLAFINGVDHDPATGLVYLNETWAGQVWSLNTNTGDLALLASGLPGYPDNLEFDVETGLVWVALPSLRAPEQEALHGQPFLKRLLWRWIQIAGLPPLPDRPVLALALSPGGDPVTGVIGPNGAGITTAIPYEGELWVAGLERDGVEAYTLPGPGPGFESAP